MNDEDDVFTSTDELEQHLALIREAIDEGLRRVRHQQEPRDD